VIAFAIGIGASVVADRRDPEGAAERRAEAEEPLQDDAQTTPSDP